MKPGVAKGIHWWPKKSISLPVRSQNITYLLTDRYVLGHVTGLNGFYLSRFKTPFLNLPVLYIPCKLQRIGYFYILTWKHKEPNQNLVQKTFLAVVAIFLEFISKKDFFWKIR